MSVVKHYKPSSIEGFESVDSLAVVVALVVVVVEPWLPPLPDSLPRGPDFFLVFPPLPLPLAGDEEEDDGVVAMVAGCIGLSHRVSCM